ncbi:hypothetical protein [Legionella drancourtii]|uniref:Uncharacterized protein n=1 Tax=Legionella drancourtii LLAP12 TaxID=658187 RepID=G9EMK0_9GAMM|nr:hypothetical protein [Legionella drancourtii]EHL31536.1 hypothetical protein LDG_6468 [Legionella drancourtii LLAP12]
MRTKHDSVQMMIELGKIVKQEFEGHNILGLNDIISWKEGYDFKKTQAPHALYQRQIASRKPLYDEVNFKIEYLRSYLHSISTQLGIKYAFTVYRIALCQFGLGLCAEQAHLAHFILKKVCLNRGISIDSKMMTLFSRHNQCTHAFILYGSNLQGLTNQFSSLQDLDETAYVYDPTYKIFSSAKEYVKNLYMVALCENYQMNNLTARDEDNLLSQAKKESLDAIEDGIIITLKHSRFGINTALAENKGDPKVLKILKDFQIDTAKRPSILNLFSPIDPAVPTVSIPATPKTGYPIFYLFHVKQSEYNAKKWDEHRKKALTDLFEYEPKRIAW